MSASNTPRQPGARYEGHLILKTGILTVVVLFATHLLSDPPDTCAMLERTQTNILKLVPDSNNSHSKLERELERLSRKLGCRKPS